MRAIRRLIGSGLSAALAALSGCEAMQPHQQARQEMTERWDLARAAVKARLADEQLAAGQIETAAEAASEALLLDPNNPQLKLLQGRVLLAQDASSRARSVLGSIEADGALGAEAHYLLGTIAQQRLEWPAAERHFQAAHALDPVEITHLSALVQVLLQRGEAGRALEVLTESEQLLGWTSGYQAALAECHEQRGDFASAAGAWRRVLAVADDDAALKERLAAALWRSGQWTDAVELLEGLVEQASDGQERFRLMLAECLLESGREQEARERIASLLQSGQDPRALALLARLLAREGAFERALRVAEQAVRADPQHAALRELAATLAYRSGNAAAAAHHAEAALSLKGRSGSAVAARVLELCGGDEAGGSGNVKP